MDSKLIYNPKELYVIACIFNPAEYSIRTNLYKQFESFMLKSNINLITIECIFAHQKQTFSVTKSENPNHIQVSAENPIWIKENLINLAIDKLPKDWKYVLWLDSDIEYLESNWTDKIISAFQKYDFIQAFNYADFLGPHSEILETHYSMMYSFINKIPIERKYFKYFYPHPGYAWGFSRKGYETVGKLIDFSIVGSGDMFMAYALINRVKETLDLEKYSQNFHNKLFIWQAKAKRLFDAGKVGYADAAIKHYFHGFRKDRQYVARNNIIFENDYKPDFDLIYNEFGVVQIKEQKINMIKRLKDYFFSRKEDINIEKSEEDLIKQYLSIYKGPEELLIEAERLKLLVQNEEKKKLEKSKIKENNNLYEDENDLSKLNCNKELIIENNLLQIESNDEDYKLNSSKVENTQLFELISYSDSSQSDLMNGNKIEIGYELNFNGNISNEKTEFSSGSSNSEIMENSSDINYSEKNSFKDSSHKSDYRSKAEVDDLMVNLGICNSTHKNKNSTDSKSNNNNNYELALMKRNHDHENNYKANQNEKTNNLNNFNNDDMNDINQINNFDKIEIPNEGRDLNAPNVCEILDEDPIKISEDKKILAENLKKEQDKESNKKAKEKDKKIKDENKLNKINVNQKINKPNNEYKINNKNHHPNKNHFYKGVKNDNGFSDHIYEDNSIQSINSNGNSSSKNYDCSHSFAEGNSSHGCSFHADDNCGDFCAEDYY